MAECTCANPDLVAKSLAPSPQQSVSTQIKTSSDEIHKTLYGAAHEDGKGDGSASSASATGVPGMFDTIRFCHWAAPEYGGQGEKWWTMLFQAAALAIAIANGVAQSEIADMRQDLADRYYNMAKYKWDRFSQKYMPLEKKLLNETSSAPIRDIDCAGADTRAQQAVNLAYDGILDFMARTVKSYRLCIDESYTTVVDNRRNLMTVDTENYNLADERWFTDVKNDQRWNRRSNVLNLGRNLSSQAMSYGDVANSLLKQVGAQLDRAASGMIQAFGYYGARNDTFYPTSYLASASGLGTNMVNVSTPGSITPTDLNPTGDK